MNKFEHYLYCRTLKITSENPVVDYLVPNSAIIMSIAYTADRPIVTSVEVDGGGVCFCHMDSYEVPGPFIGRIIRVEGKARRGVVWQASVLVTLKRLRRKK